MRKMIAAGPGSIKSDLTAGRWIKRRRSTRRAPECRVNTVQMVTG